MAAIAGHASAQRFLDRISEPEFPCVGAKSALAHSGIEFHEAGDLRGNEGDQELLRRLQAFAGAAAEDALFLSFVALFPDTPMLDEPAFERALWQRLQALHELDAREFDWDPKVSADPSSPAFSMSLGGRAFYVIGLHPGSSRRARRFDRTALVFNLHSQFELLRSDGRYERMCEAIGARDIDYSGSRNPMLAAHGEVSEARQYSGRQVGADWRCPFSSHAREHAEFSAVPVPKKVPLGNFERLPNWLDLVPMVIQWTWLGIRYGSISLPSAANPGITSGGLVGEGKLEYFAAMGPLARAATADFIGVRNEAALEIAQVEARMTQAGLGFPIVAKPDVGWCGFGVRLLADADELQRYLRSYPLDETFLLQRYLPEPGEAGLFYVREPDAAQGRLIGLLLRDYPAVIGNGRDSIATLIAADPRLRRATGTDRHECRYDPARVPAEGEAVRLSTVASTRVGGCYRDGTALVTPELTARVDAIAKDMAQGPQQQFLVGRFDVRYSDLAALRAGEFTIMEVNGAGSEAVHAFDPKYTIREVYGIVFAKQRLLFAIADANRRLGAKPIPLLELGRLWLRQRRIMRAYPASN